MRFDEDHLVQETTANYLRDQLGWESVYAYNTETFGPKGTLRRRDDTEVVLTGHLRDALEKLNPDLPKEAYANAVRTITEVSAAQSTLQTNREKYSLLRGGVKVSFRSATGGMETRTLRVFDFDNPESNHFLCVRELWIKGALYRRRADIVGFVNGVPLLFMELKSPRYSIQRAYNENLSDYRDTIPLIFHHNAIVVLGNGNDARLGSFSAPLKFFREWKRLHEDEPGVVNMETLLKGVCSKANFLDLFENFILFDDSTGETFKIVAQNQQFIGVNKAIDAVERRKDTGGKLGVFWHTQGAGKSYSMVFFARKVHRRIGSNFTFLVLTDRDDLDNQIYRTFIGCGAVGENDDARAASGDDLRGKLSNRHAAYIFSLIQKFNKQVPDGTSYSDRSDIIVMTDEAHRTQYGDLALNMRKALPNASFIGFTGTPLMKNDNITKRVYGGYTSKYGFQRAVEDGATVPLYYDARGEKLGLDHTELNERIAEKLEEFENEVSDIDVAQRLERELKREYHIMTAKERLKAIAKDFVVHYSTRWESGKAMVVCMDKVTCARMHKFIAEEWQARVSMLERELAAATEEQEAIYRRRQIEWMKATISAVVISEEQGEVEKFRKWDIDVVPHRRLIKDGFATGDGKRVDIETAFKRDGRPFRIAIVCAMWLTGFDVKSLASLYLDKPLKPMYRSRSVDNVVSLRQLPSDVETYAAPPAAHVGEGRFNHAGSPMLYLADAQNTALAEIGKPGHQCHVARIRVRIPLKVLDLVDIDEDDPNFDLFAAIANSALLSAPRTGDGWLKEQYVFSRFVADCARSAGFDAIRYGSTKAPQGTNYVLVEPQAKLGHIADLEDVETLVCPLAAVRY